MAQKHLERCDECGEFVAECSLVVAADDNGLSICKKCNWKRSAACNCTKRSLIMHDGALECRICHRPPVATPEQIAAVNEKYGFY